MTGGRLRRSFRHQLLLAFLLLGTLPAVLLSLIYLRYLRDSIALIQNPGVEALLQNSLEMARASIEPFELVAAEHARAAARSGELARAVARGDSAAARAALASVAAAAPRPVIAEVALFLLPAGAGEGEEAGPVWSPAQEREAWAARLRRGPPRASASPEGSATALDAAAGVVWCRLPLAGAPGWEVAAGLALPPPLAARARDLASGAALYRSLGAYKEVRLRRMWTVAALLVVLLGAASWAVSRGLSRRLSQPIVHLLEGTRRIGGGDYRHRIATTRDDELGRLIEAFNRMGEALEQRTDELRRTERIAAWRDVARGIAHQIKNPLTPIVLSMHRLRGLAAGSEEASRPDREAVMRDCLETVTQEVENLRRIADEFSSFARLPEPRPRPVELLPLVRGAAELYHAGNPRVELRFEMPGSLPPLELDPDLTRQAVSNLVKNAIEAMPGGGRLSVAVKPVRGAVRIEVADTGGGIAASVKERLFTPYVTTKTGGTGLGLALAWRMISDQGGTLEVLTAPEPGTTFRIEFPTRERRFAEVRHAGAGHGDDTDR